MPWRLLLHEGYNASANMAIDEAIMHARIKNKVCNTLRFFSWCPSAVSIGRHQDVSAEVNVENCMNRRVDIVRRISGGGAVYHDSTGEITYSVVVNQKDLGTNDVAEAYCRICNGVIEGVHVLGVNAAYGQGNLRQCPSITASGRKISGSAQALKKGVILQHGTLLLEVDLERMFSFLKIPHIESYVDRVNLGRRRITCLADELGESIGFARAFKALTEGFKKALGLELVEGDLTDYEVELAKSLKKKFGSTDWMFRRIDQSRA